MLCQHSGCIEALIQANAYGPGARAGAVFFLGTFKDPRPQGVGALEPFPFR
jgi:hypothetical protein